MIDFFKILFDGAHFDFTIEIIARSVFMFLLILIVLRLSGRRGVRQLTLFEVAIILGLGSAASDPMFQESIPIIYPIIVFISVIIFYKSLTFLASKSKHLTQLMEGKEMIIVKNGMFSIEESKASNFSQREFFAELRNHSIEHLGQVRCALLEVDGTISIIRYPKKETQFGLPLFPGDYKKLNSLQNTGPYACMFCGNINHQLEHIHQKCQRCERDNWTKAINTLYQ